MAWLRAAAALLVAGVVAAALVSGGSEADPRTPPALPGLPPPFLGTAVVGGGGLAAAVDAYGDVVDLRAPGPAGRGLIDNPAERQAAGTVAADTGIVPRVGLAGDPPLPLWRADSVTQRYLPGTNVVRTMARFGRIRMSITDAVTDSTLARVAAVEAPPEAEAVPAFAADVVADVRCEQASKERAAILLCAPTRADVQAATGQGGVATGAARVIRAAIADDRRWIAVAAPLGAGAPGWARTMYRRSLLTLRALTDRRTGAVAAGARDDWAYVWPRDAAAAALAFAAAGYRPEARRAARFLLGLDLGAAARFHGDGTPVDGREAQGDAAGWVAVAARAAGLRAEVPSLAWRSRSDYQERDPGDYLANAIASSYADGPQTPLYGGKTARRHRPASIEGAFGTEAGLVRQARDPGSGLDSVAAWGVRPFAQPALFPAIRRTLLRLADNRSSFGIRPSEDWGGIDPWSAPTAWTAWSLAALGERRTALALLSALRRSATPAGALPERVDVRTGVPRSTTPLAWSHAFAILALRRLWP